MLFISKKNSWYQQMRTLRRCLSASLFKAAASWSV